MQRLGFGRLSSRKYLKKQPGFRTSCRLQKNPKENSARGADQGRMDAKTH
jgi:hypothetical protein